MLVVRRVLSSESENMRSDAGKSLERRLEDSDPAGHLHYAVKTRVYEDCAAAAILRIECIMDQVVAR